MATKSEIAAKKHLEGELEETLRWAGHDDASWDSDIKDGYPNNNICGRAAKIAKIVETYSLDRVLLTETLTKLYDKLIDLKRFGIAAALAKTYDL